MQHEDSATSAIPDEYVWSWNLAALRSIYGVTQRALAETTHTHSQVISRIETNQQRDNSIRTLVMFYRYFWQLGKHQFDSSNTEPRHITLTDLIIVPQLIRPATPSLFNQPIIVRPIRTLPGVWWCIEPLRQIYNAQTASERLTLTAVAQAAGQSQQNLWQVAQNGKVGSVPLLVNVTVYFARVLRPSITLDDVLYIQPDVPPAT